MSDPSEDLSSMGFTSFGKTPKHHQTAPIHANPTPFPTSSTSTSLPPRPPFQQGNQPPHNQHHNNNNNNQNYRGRGGRNFNNRGGRGGGGQGHQGHQGHQGQGGPHRRNFHTNPQFQRGGRGGRHHHPYPHRQSHDNHNHQQRQDFTTSSSTPSYRSKEFGEGLYKPSMNEDPWAPLTQNKQSQSQSQSQPHQQSKTPITTTTTPNDVWMGQTAAATSTNIEDKSTWYDKPEDKAADGGGWNADEIDLGDD
ncbi:hypothetical protein TWF970_011539 [Orbilia oligospora]|uniref:Uncharacterized protein n=1 Tax=Orbilia oligospora TaxID=2813651 RepID=A0A7C8VSA4_ORBOL|nr:hypothetical protein TWF970_011539 [Orbilia oligospora]